MTTCLRRAAFFLASLAAWTSSAVSIPRGTEAQFETASGVFLGEVVSTRPFLGADRHIYTETILRVLEVYKGVLPERIKLTHRGGEFGGVAESDCLSVDFRAGERRLCFIERDGHNRANTVFGEAGAAILAPSKQSSLKMSPPSASAIASAEILTVIRRLAARMPAPGLDFTDLDAGASTEMPPSNSPGVLNAMSTATNLMTDDGGLGSRFLAPDRGEPVRYYVDATFLPEGITRAQATQAVESALAAWSSATSLKFSFAGFRNYGLSVGKMVHEDGAVHIQLHDAYGFITGAGDILGRGGLRRVGLNLSNGWTMGGNVAGNDFQETRGAWLVINHKHHLLCSPENLAEVICHELGHALSLGHSSNLPLEPTPQLAQSIMYYAAHSDGRGAVLNAHDTNVIRQAYPAGNTPPFTFPRVMDVVTAFDYDTTPFNTIELRGCDLQTTNPAIQTGDRDEKNGTFKLTGQFLGFTPKSGFGAARLDPAGSQHYGILYYRYADGTNASPYRSVRVVSFALDNFKEGIPDDWRIEWFGGMNPGSGPKRRANDDFDGDGLTNLQEFRLGSSPVDRFSNLRLSASGSNLSWVAKPYELYEVRMTEDLARWPDSGAPVLPSTSNAVFTVDTSAPRHYHRVVKLR